MGICRVWVGIAYIEAPDDLSARQVDTILHVIRVAGVEFWEGKKEILAQRIKSIVLEAVYEGECPLMSNLSTYLSEKLLYDYTYMSNVFSEIENKTIERFYICHRIERAKELLIYEGLSIKDIAEKLRYSSVAHLSGQFKKVTGMSPSQFKGQIGEGDLPPEAC